jgi:hypothetical protein
MNHNTWTKPHSLMRDSTIVPCSHLAGCAHTHPFFRGFHVAGIRVPQGFQKVSTPVQNQVVPE